MQDSKIEWTDKTWNPVTGCTKVSQGCKNCYAERMYERFHGHGSFKNVVEHTERLLQPMKWKNPAKIFVNSMSDLFHETVSWNFIYKVFEVMHLCPQHIFQVLTKRSERLKELDDIYLHLRRNYPGAGFPSKNVWIGVSVENQEQEQRMIHLAQIEAAVKFLSCEPLLGPITLPVDSNDAAGFFDWIIVGGESGPGARPMHPDWVRSLRDQSEKTGTTFFFKQWGEYLPQCQVNSILPFVPKEKTERSFQSPHNTNKMNTYYKLGKKLTGSILDGKEYSAFPEVKASFF